MTLIDDLCDGCGRRFDPMGDPLLTRHPEIGEYAVLCATCESKSHASADTETLAEVLAAHRLERDVFSPHCACGQWWDKRDHDGSGHRAHVAGQIEAHFAARIVQARAGEGALRERVEQIHFPIPLLAYAEDCLSPDEHEWMEADDGTELCLDCPHDDLRACSTCRDRDGGLYVDWPCETAAALTTADPS